MAVIITKLPPVKRISKIRFNPGWVVVSASVFKFVEELA
jgi:hypothetical protein